MIRHSGTSRLDLELSASLPLGGLRHACSRHMQSLLSVDYEQGRGAIVSGS